MGASAPSSRIPGTPRSSGWGSASRHEPAPAHSAVCERIKDVVLKVSVTTAISAKSSSRQHSPCYHVGSAQCRVDAVAELGKNAGLNIQRQQQVSLVVGGNIAAKSQG